MCHLSRRTVVNVYAFPYNSKTAMLKIINTLKREVHPNDLQKLISYIPQNTFLLHHRGQLVNAV
jgi:hypothetical protein